MSFLAIWEFISGAGGQIIGWLGVGGMALLAFFKLRADQQQLGELKTKTKVQDETIDSLKRQQKAAASGPHTADDAADRLSSGRF